jgi:hypothetical protein
MSLLFTILMSAALSATFLLTWWCWRDLVVFQARTTMLRTAEDMARFKRVASRHMYAVLVDVVLEIFISVGVGVGLMRALVQGERHEIWVALGGVGLCLNLFSSVWCWYDCREVMNTPVLNEELFHERNRVVHIWKYWFLPPW